MTGMSMRCFAFFAELRCLGLVTFLLSPLYVVRNTGITFLQWNFSHEASRACLAA